MLINEATYRRHHRLILSTSWGVLRTCLESLDSETKLFMMTLDLRNTIVFGVQ